MSTTVLPESSVTGLRMRASRNPIEHGYDPSNAGYWYGTCDLTVNGRDVCFHTWGESHAEVTGDLGEGALDLGASAEQITLATEVTL